MKPALFSILALFCLAPAALAAPATRPTTVPTTRPIVIDPSNPGAFRIGPDGALIPVESKAKISKEAQVVLDSMRDAYAKLKTLEMAGKITGQFDVAGQKEDKSEAFNSAFQAPNKFRHDMKTSLLLGGTGAKVYVLDASAKQYILKDSPKDRVAGKDLPAPLPDILSLISSPAVPSANPSLLLALAKDASAELIAQASEVSKLDDVKVDDKAYTALQVTSAKGAKVTLLVDPETSLIRRATTDLKGMIEKLGAPDVKSAEVTIDYTSVKADGDVAAGLFDWTPPEGMHDAAVAAAGDEEPNAADAMVGKAAPDFTLKDLAGKDVTLSKLKGNVVVIDFWATWCPPCRASLPHLSALATDAELQKSGLRVQAVDLKEGKDKVQKFLTDNKLTLPVLLDTDGAVAQKYAVSGIPQTVVVGRDGSVKKVFVGFGPGSAEKLKAAVEEALKEQAPQPVE